MVRRIIIVVFLTFLVSRYIVAQEPTLQSEIERLMYGSCSETVNFEILLKDVKKSLELLSYFKSDTLDCFEQKIYETSCQLLYQSDDSNVIHYFINYTLNTNSIYCGYLINCIYDKIEFAELKSDDLERLISLEIKNCNSRSVPLLFSYLGIKSMIPALKEWRNSHSLSNYDKTILSVSLARLGDSIELHKIIEKNIKSDNEWLTYLDYFNFIRNKKSTEILVDLLSNDKEVVLEEIPDAYIIIRCKLSALALYHLSMFIEDFPFRIEYSNLYENLDDKIKLAQNWFEQHKNYNLSTFLGDFKL